MRDLNDAATPELLEDDWIANFFDKCRLISDEEMQTLWARVLAGEGNAPGKFTKRTVNLLGSLDKEDAKLFGALCGIGFFFGDVVPLVYDHHEPIYKAQGLTFPALTHLDAIGLVRFDPMGGFKKIGTTEMVTIFYYGTPIILVLPKDNWLDVGKLVLTKVGQELAPICGSTPVDGFLDFVLERWLTMGIVCSSPFPHEAEESRASVV